MYYDQRHRDGMEYAFNRAATGTPIRIICTELTERGFTNALGRPFSLTALKDHLHNPVHCDPRHPLISAELFDAVQRQLESNRHSGGNLT